MKMHVPDGLVGGGAVVLEDIKILRPGRPQHRPTQPRQDPPQGGGRVVRQLVERFGRFFGDDQGMPRS